MSLTTQMIREGSDLAKVQCMNHKCRISVNIAWGRVMSGEISKGSAMCCRSCFKNDGFKLVADLTPEPKTHGPYPPNYK